MTTTADAARGANAAKARAARTAQRLGRIEDAHFLQGLGEIPKDIAPRMGVSLDTLYDYLGEEVTVPEGPELPDDGYDAAQDALEPERRIARAKPFAADFVRVVAASDAEGVRLLLHRVRDWAALVIVLAECADPGRTAVVTGQAKQRGEEAA
jgi:hypothetical protein